MYIKQISFPNGSADIDAIEQQLTSSVQAMVPQGSTYSLTTQLDNPDNLDPRILSNIWRIRQAAGDGEMFYLDADCRVNQWPQFTQTGKPYFIQTNLNLVGCYAFYVNGCMQFFASILPEVQASKTPWTISDILNRHRDEVLLFPKSCISHFALSNASQNFLAFGDGTCGVKKVNGVWQLS